MVVCGVYGMRRLWWRLFESTANHKGARFEHHWTMYNLSDPLRRNVLYLREICLYPPKTQCRSISREFLNYIHRSYLSWVHSRCLPTARSSFRIVEERTKSFDLARG